jgi:hypothetical protein
MITVSTEVAGSIWKLIDNLSIVRLIKESAITPGDANRLMEFYNGNRHLFEPGREQQP